MRHFSVLIVVSLLTLSTGCATSARLSAAQMRRLDNLQPDALTVLAKATDARRDKSDRIGKHTFTILMIPTITVYSEDPVDEKVGELFVTALKETGYQVTTVNSLAKADGPVLTLQTDSLNNYLFSWLYPIGITAGRGKFTPLLFAKDGTVLWRGKQVVGSGGSPSLLYMCGFDTSLRAEMTTVLRGVIEQLNTQQFKNAASGGTKR